MSVDSITAFCQRVRQDTPLRECLRQVQEQLRAQTLTRAGACSELVRLAAAAGFQFTAEEYETYAKEANASRGALTETELD